jgi:hypothetical protein
MKWSILPPELFKTGQITPQAVLKRRVLQYHGIGIVAAGCYSTSGFAFFFFIYFG